MPDPIAYIYKEKIKVYGTTRYMVGCAYVNNFPGYWHHLAQGKDYIITVNKTCLFYNKINNTFDIFDTEQTIKPFVCSKQEADIIVNRIAKTQQTIEITPRLYNQRQVQPIQCKFYPQIQRPKYKAYIHWNGSTMFNQTFNDNILQNIKANNKDKLCDNIIGFVETNYWYGSKWFLTANKRFSRYARGSRTKHKAIHKLKNFMPYAKYEI